MDYYSNLTLELNHLSMATKQIMAKYISELNALVYSEKCDSDGIKDSVPTKLTHIRGYIQDRSLQDIFKGWYGVVEMSNGLKLSISERQLSKLMSKFNIRFINF